MVKRQEAGSTMSPPYGGWVSYGGDAKIQLAVGLLTLAGCAVYAGTRVRPARAVQMAATAVIVGAALSCATVAAPALAAPAGSPPLFRFRLAPLLGWPGLLNAVPALPQGGGARFRTVDVPGADDTLVDGVNDGSVLVGTYIITGKGAKQFGFIEQGKHLTKFNYPGTAGVTFASSINDRGATVGYYTDAAGTFDGWIRSADGRFCRLDDPSAAKGAGQGTLPVGINDAGTIVGEYLDKDNVAHGFIYNPKSGFTTVDAPGAGTGPGQGTVLVSVNDSGVIVGTDIDARGVYHTFVYSQRSFFGFGTPGAGTGSGQGAFPGGITRDGVIDGTTINAKSVFSGWLVSGGHFSPIDDPFAANGPDLGTEPFGINQRGDEGCGGYWDASGHIHGFVATLPR
jgi:hypothetical protein